MSRIFALLVLALSANYALASPCAATPVAAARLAVGDSSESAQTPALVASSVGFRAVGMHFDPLLHKLWFRVVDCKFPERPAVLVPVSLQTDMVQTVNPVLPQEAKVRTLAVRAGQTVDLLYQQGPAKIHVRGISEANGYIGDHIVLRPVAALGGAPDLRLHASVTAEGEGVLLP